jgi:hypothetical protein
MVGAVESVTGHIILIQILSGCPDAKHSWTAAWHINSFGSQH